MRSSLVPMAAIAVLIAAPAAAQENAVTAENNAVAANVLTDPALPPATTTDPTVGTTATDPALTTTMPPADTGTFGAEPVRQDRGGGFPWGLLGLIGLAGLLGRSRRTDVDTRAP